MGARVGVQVTEDDLLAIWWEFTGDPVDQLRSRLKGSPHRRRLLRLDVERLQRGAQLAMEQWGRPGLPLNLWADEAEAIPSAGVRNQKSAPRQPWAPRDNRATLVDFVRLLSGPEREQYVHGLDLPDETLSEAVRRLRLRAWQPDLSPPLFPTVLARRPARWQEAASGANRQIPVVEADEAEIAIVVLLAWTKRRYQFAATSSGRGLVYPSDRWGWLPPGDGRVYVDGLSDVLDTLGPLVISHREGVGGRFYIDEVGAFCGACRGYLAWIAAEPRKQRASRHLAGVGCPIGR